MSGGDQEEKCRERRGNAYAYRGTEKTQFNPARSPDKKSERDGRPKD